MTDLNALRKANRRSGVTSIVAGVVLVLVSARFLWFYSSDPATLALQGLLLICGVVGICAGWLTLRRFKTM